MLTLTRRVGEALRIGEHVSLVIISAHGNQVKVGIAGPSEVRVDRESVPTVKAFSGPEFEFDDVHLRSSEKNTAR